jgi:hypothetical protein
MLDIIKVCLWVAALAFIHLISYGAIIVALLLLLIL